MSVRSDQYISEVRSANLAIWNGVNQLVSLQREFNAGDYGNTLKDGNGANTGYTKLDVGSVVFDTANAFVAVLAAGHATNMQKLL